MGIFDGMNNPWAPGGQMSPRMPWASPGLNYGWGHGNEFFTPKTKEQIHKEAMLQLAVLAAVLVAPAIVGAAGGAGAAGAAGAGGGGGAAAAGGTAAVESAGAVLAQGAVTAGGGAAVAGGSSLLAGLGLAAALQPFLQADSAQALQRAAIMGEEELGRELQRRSNKDCDCPPKPKFATEDWERRYGDCGCGEGMQENHSSHILLRLAETIEKDPRLARSLIEVSKSRSNATVSSDLLKKLVGITQESLPNSFGVQGLHNVLEISRPVLAGDPNLKRRGRITIDETKTSISGIVYVKFDNDAMLGDDPELTKSLIAAQIQESINKTLNSNTRFGIIPVQSEILVIPLEDGSRPPEGSHTFVFGNGASDPNWDPKDSPNPEISNAEKCGNRGYLYNTEDAGHEFLHWLGLEDRYTEVVVLTGRHETGGVFGSDTNQYNNPDRNKFPPQAVWGRHSGIIQSLPLGKVRDDEPDYFCMINAMAVKGETHLTEYQLDVIFNKRCEEKYPRDVVGYLLAGENPDTEQAIEFDPQHNAYWWDVTTNKRIPNNSLNLGPSTIRRLGDIYFGQKFSRINQFLYDVVGSYPTQIHAVPPRGNGNRYETNLAIKHNQ